MEIHQLTAILESCIGLVVLIVLLLELWPAHRVDRFRQDMFIVRDELFDYAASGAVDFTDPAYRLLRQSMNGFIRYAHRLSLFQLMLTMSIWRVWGCTPDINWATQFDKAVLRIKDPEVQSRMSSFHSRTMLLVSRQLIYGSPVLIAVLVIGAIGALLHSGIKSARQWSRDYAVRSVSRVIDPRLIEEEASRLAA